MPRKLRVEYPGAIYHLMSRSNGKGVVFETDVDRQDLRTVCDYVHLNPVRAKLLKPEQRLLEYPWSSFGHYLSAPPHRAAWLRVDRLLGEHGIERDDTAGINHDDSVDRTPTANGQLEKPQCQAASMEENS